MEIPDVAGSGAEDRSRSRKGEIHEEFARRNRDHRHVGIIHLRTDDQTSR